MSVNIVDKTTGELIKVAGNVAPPTDSVTGGDMRPVTSNAVYDNIGAKLRTFNIDIPANTTNYNYESKKPSDFASVVSAISYGGGGLTIRQINNSAIFYEQSDSNGSKVRILYLAI